MNKLHFSFFLLFSSLLFFACSASTDTRYSKTKESKETSSTNIPSVEEDDFDISPYKTQIDIPSKSIETKKTPTDLWFGYNTTDSTQNLVSVTDTIPGYRVEVISSDNLDEVNSVRSEVYFKANEKALYVIFEPPFYVLRVGDCKTINDAKALSFKLNQLGFSGTKIVNDKIIVQR